MFEGALLLERCHPNSYKRPAENLIPLHELFDNLIHRFSQAEAPMICEVISRLERLERSMTRVAMLPGSLASFPLKGKRCFDEWKVLCTL